MQPVSAVAGAELVAEYELDDMSTYPAGVAYTHATMRYQTVNLGFGIEYMMDDMIPGGTYGSGLPDRADLLGNIMEYFGKVPTLPGTDVEEGIVFATALAAPHPNPFNPTTTVSYTVGLLGRVTIKVYDLAGRVVRTLVDGAHEVGEYEVLWDGRTDTGDRAASGVYFIRMTTAGDDPGGAATGHGSSIRAESRQQKLVLLK